MRFVLRFTWFLTALLTASLSARAQITFTGDVSADFASAPNCFADGLTLKATPGFDIERACFHYDGALDRLYIGIETVDDAVFGDTDGDGNPGASSTNGVADEPDLGGSETVVVSLDMDGDSAAGEFDSATVDLLIGVSNTGAFAQLGVFRPAANYLPESPGAGFGIPTTHTVTLSTPPSSDKPDLEFMVNGFFASSPVQDGFADNPVIQIFADYPASESASDFLPSTGLSLDYPLYDFDADGLDDWEELEIGTTVDNIDTDGDGLTDGVEVNGANATDPLNPDSDGDGLADGEEDSDGDGEQDLFETDPNNADSDTDGLPDGVEILGANPTNPLETDSDGDGLTDGDEDANANGEVDPGETDPVASDTDVGGVSDGLEEDNGFNPLDPSDDTQAGTAVGQTGAPPATFDSLMGGGVGCALVAPKPGEGALVLGQYDPQRALLALIGVTFLLLWCCLRVRNIRSRVSRELASSA